MEYLLRKMQEMECFYETGFEDIMKETLDTKRRLQNQTTIVNELNETQFT